jgi:hypothetical protein
MALFNHQSSRQTSRLARNSRVSSSLAQAGKRRLKRNVRRLTVEPLESRRLLAVISGEVIFDTNANGAVDSDESGAADVAVVLKDSAGSVVSGPVTTDGTGVYSFGNVADGDYEVAIQFASGTDQLQSFPGRITNPDRLGTVLSALDSPLPPLVDDPTPVGLVWVDNELWTANRQGNDGSNAEKKIFGWNGTDWQEKFVARGATGSIQGLTYDGTYLWAADHTDSKILQYDPAAADANGDNFPIATFTHPTNPDLQPSGIAWDGQDFWVIEEDAANNDHTLQRWSIDTASGSVTVAETLQLSFDEPIGLEYNDGQLWLTSRSTDSIYAVDIAASSGGTAAIVEQFPAPAENQNFPTGITIADDSLWIAQYIDNRIWQLDLGSPESRPVTVSGTDVTVADFGVSAYGQVAGVVYADLDHDGIQDASEAGVDGWQVYRDQNGNGQFDAYEQIAQTDANGAYLIEQVLPGSQTISVNTKTPGWINTTVGSLTETLLARTTSTADFGVFQSGFGPSGGEVRVNQTVDGFQGASEVAINMNGYSAFAFASLEAPGVKDVFFRISDADGNPVTGEVSVDAATSGDQWRPTISNVEGTEHFVVGWSTGVKPDRQGYIRIYDQQGIAQTAPIAIEAKNAETYVVQIDSNTQGEMIVLFNEVKEAKGPSTSDNDVIHVQRFDTGGNALGNAIEIADPQSIPTRTSATLAEDGSFVVVWKQATSELLAQRYDASGKATGNQITVRNGDIVWTTRAANDQNGNFAIGWTEGSSSNKSAKLSYYDASGVRQGSIFELTSSTYSTETLGLAMTNQGEIALSWHELSPNSSSEVMAQRLRFDDATGQLVALDASPYVVNTTSGGKQERSHVAFGPEGQMSVVWNGNGPGDDAGVFMQRYTSPPANQAPSVAISSPSDGTTVAGTSVEITASVSDADGTISLVEFFVNGVSIGTDPGEGGTATTAWDSTTVGDGTYEILVEATDDQGAKSSDVVLVVIDNNAAPSVAITSPSEGETLVGSTTIFADANDTDGVVSQVDFYVSNTLIGSDSDGSDGWSIDWDSTTVANGSQTLLAVATDDAGESTDSVQVTINVDNPVADDVIFVGDIDGSAANEGKNWIATVSILVVDSSGNHIHDATVSGQWTGGFSGSATGTTDANGLVTLSSGNIRKNADSTTFTVSNVNATGLTYDADKNTDPDGDSSGTSITVFKDGSTSPGQAMHTSLTHAMSHPLSTLASGRTLSLEAAEQALDQAMIFWQESRGLQVDSPIDLQVIDLPGQQLGWSAGPLLQLDVDGAGHGWALSTDMLGKGGYDLLSVVTHEVGHFFGFGHDDEGLMSPQIDLHESLLRGSIFISALPTESKLHLRLSDHEGLTRHANAAVVTDAVEPGKIRPLGFLTSSAPAAPIMSSTTRTATTAFGSTPSPKSDSERNWYENVDRLLTSNFLDELDDELSVKLV